MVNPALSYSKEQIVATVTAIKDRSQAYRLTFGGEWGQRVLCDLILFCRGFESAAVPGDRDKTFMSLGRQEVFQRIVQELCLTPAQLATIYSGGRIKLVDETDADEETDNA